MLYIVASCSTQAFMEKTTLPFVGVTYRLPWWREPAGSACSANTFSSLGRRDNRTSPRSTVSRSSRLQSQRLFSRPQSLCRTLLNAVTTDSIFTRIHGGTSVFVRLTSHTSKKSQLLATLQPKRFSPRTPGAGSWSSNVCMNDKEVA